MEAGLLLKSSCLELSYRMRLATLPILCSLVVLKLSAERKLIVLLFGVLSLVYVASTIN